MRPEPVLVAALKMLESKWNNKKVEYKYIDDQFRSLRQDLTVQRIQNDFCVKVSQTYSTHSAIFDFALTNLTSFLQVYETHARIALEEADLDQFNQC